jgi:hypothetical protein
MTTNQIHLDRINRVAQGLKKLREQVVFVGGAAVALYADDPASEEVRPTVDIDVAIALVGFGDWAQMQGYLAEIGFMPDPQHTVICRYQYEDMIVDIMPDQESPIGATNRWFAPGIKHRERQIINGTEIYRMPLPYFLASKIEALNDRGNDLRWSHDLEDIIMTINNVQKLTAKKMPEHQEVQHYVGGFFTELLSKTEANEIIAAQLSPIAAKQRLGIILNRIELLAKLGD